MYWADLDRLDKWPKFELGATREEVRQWFHEHVASKRSKTHVSDEETEDSEPGDSDLSLVELQQIFQRLDVGFIVVDSSTMECLMSQARSPL